MAGPAHLRIADAHDPGSIPIVRQLFSDYAQWLGEDDWWVQEFQAEISTLPGVYAPPRGALLVAWVDGAPAGCVAMRPLEPGICEMKRLWVSGSFRGLGVGRELVAELLARARQAGHRRMRLDTLQRLAGARALYGAFGFAEIAAYNGNPASEAIYLEKTLS